MLLCLECGKHTGHPIHDLEPVVRGTQDDFENRHEFKDPRQEEQDWEDPVWAVKMKIGKVGKTIYVNAPDAEAAERKALERFKIVEVTRLEKE